MWAGIQTHLAICLGVQTRNAWHDIEVLQFLENPWRHFALPPNTPIYARLKKTFVFCIPTMFGVFLKYVCYCLDKLFNTYSDIVSFVGDINNAVIKFPIYFKVAFAYCLRNKWTSFLLSDFVYFKHGVGSNQFLSVNICVIRLLSVITTTPFGWELMLGFPKGLCWALSCSLYT